MLMTILVGQCSSTCFGRCHPSDLPGHLTKAKAAWHCISLLCSTVSAFCLWDALSGHAAVSLPGITWWWNTRGASSSWERTWGRCHIVPQKHLLWVSTAGHSWLQDSWLDGVWVWSGSSFWCVGSQRARLGLWLQPGFYSLSFRLHRSNPQGPEKAGGRLLANLIISFRKLSSMPNAINML